MGAEQPLVVRTDHKNLAYIQTVKWLNSCQAHWALFLGRFNFTLTYRLRSRNIKPDSLSHLHTSEESPSIPDTILPSTCVVAEVSWEIESAVREAQRTQPTESAVREAQQPDPGNGPPNCLYVPCSVCSRSSSGCIILALPAILG